MKQGRYEITGTTNEAYGEHVQLYYNAGKWRRLEDGDAEVFTLQGEVELIARCLFDENRESDFPFKSIQVHRWDWDEEAEEDKRTTILVLT